MEKHLFGGCMVEFDREPTAVWYANYAGWGCDCGHCRNFLKLAKEGTLPAYILNTLSSLGIPPEKATYVSELFTDQTGIHYQFSYRLAGTILEETTPSANEEAGRCCHEPYPYGAPDFPAPHFDLEFYGVLPWILE